MGASNVLRGMKRKGGLRPEPTTYRLSLAPTGRARCRACKRTVDVRSLRVEACVFVMPGRRTTFVAHTQCVPVGWVREIVRVYGSADRLPVQDGVDAALAAEARQRIAGLVA